VAIDEKQHVALPKLYGQPAYARPPRQASATARPFDPDDLPLEVSQTNEERQWISSLPPRAFQPGGGLTMGGEAANTTTAHDPSLSGRPFRLKMLAGKLLGTGSKSS
jgi:hypothetical protein